MLSQGLDRVPMLEKIVEKQQDDLDKTKHQSDLKDLKIQEVKFYLQDAETRLKQSIQSEDQCKGKNEELLVEVCALKEEILLLKRESDGSTRADSQIAELQFKFNAIALENKTL